MKIALVGEFSGLHANLKVGLQQLGHEAVVVAAGDGFKQIPSDRHLGPRTAGRLALARYLILEQPDLLASLATEFDVIQFIHPEALVLPHHGRVAYARWLFGFLRTFKGVVSMAVAGCDPYTQPLMARSPFSACVGCLTDSDRPICTYDFESTTRRATADALLARADVVIPFGAGINAAAYSAHAKNSPVLNFPVDLSTTPPPNERTGPLRLLHGINRPGFKGTPTILRAIRTIVDAAPDMYELHVPERLPFAEYDSLLSTINVVIDQLRGDGLGMNALLSMARGRIVLTSFERPFSLGDVDYRDAPAFDISSGVPALRSALETIQRWSNDELMTASRHSREYVERRCQPTAVARQVYAAWLGSRAGRARRV